MTDRPIRLGTMLFTLVEPHRGHEVAYNRWYERDHFYAGCMIGPYNFAGRRFVAPRELKALRFPDPSPVAPARDIGSYLALYWILDGHHDEWNHWAVEQVNRLHAAGRMFPARDHIHTALYRHEWAATRDPDGVPAELALDHPFAGLVAMVGESTGDLTALLDRIRGELAPAALAGSAASLCLAFTPLPLLAGAPADVPRDTAAGERFLLLWFLEAEPASAWDGFSAFAEALAAGGDSQIVWASPFVPTVPGTDTYTDKLW